MFRIMRSIRSTRFCGLFAVGVILLGASAARAVPPPADLLNGERQVLAVDDVVVAQTFKSPFAPYAARHVDLGLTSNLAITQEIGKEFTTTRLTNYGGTPKPLLVAAGRVFRSATDVGVTFTLSDSDYVSGPWLESTTFLKTEGSATITERPAQRILASSLPPRGLLLADFTGDGMADVLFHAGTTDAMGSIMVVGTSDGSESVGWLRLGPTHVGKPAGLDIKAADLDGDGRPEIVCLWRDNFFLLYLSVYKVNPTTLQITEVSSPSTGFIGGFNTTDKFRLAVGKFDGNMADAEVVVVQGGSPCTSGTTAYCSVVVKPFKVSIVSGQVTYTAAPAVDIGPSLDITSNKPWNVLTALEVTAGKLNWFGGNTRDQLVLGAGMSSGSNYKGYAAVVVDFSMNATGQQMTVDTAQVKASAYNVYNAPTVCLAGLAIGRFAPNPPEPDTGAPPTNAQVALLLASLSSGDTLSECGPDAWNTVQYTAISVGTYTVDPASSFKIAPAASLVPFPNGGSLYSGGVTFAPPRMAVGDFQGRSLFLGQPTIISVAQQMQPQVVIGAPPMHLDYFTPLGAMDRSICYSPGQVPTSEPVPSTNQDLLLTTSMGCIQNVSAYPGHTTGATACDYCARFSTTSAEGMSGFQESTTSHTWSNEVGGSASVTIGSINPHTWGAPAGLQVEAHAGGKFMDGNSNATRNGISAGKTLTLDTATGPDDYVFYSSQDVYYYLYPVLGQKDTLGHQIYLHFSVPDQVALHNVNAAELPWYQPPHEIGNIFSYPGNLKQLKSDYPNAYVGPDSPPPIEWSSEVQDHFNVKFIQDQSTEKTAGAVDRTDWNVGESVTGAVRIGGVVIKANEHYDHNDSLAHSYTNTNKKTLSASKGFDVTTATFYKVSQSAYLVNAQILGLAKPALDEGYWDDDVPMPHPKGEAGEGFVPDFNLGGPLRLVYTTNMITTPSLTLGKIWGDIYGQNPDIALQHPRRFTWVGKGSNPQSDVWKFNPLLLNTTLDTVHSSEFLMMKGFFINPASAAQGQGPQLTMTTEGTRLRLAARVYNYSLVGLPPGGTVKVRFYAHTLNPEPYGYYDLWAPNGCIFIGEDSVDIGPFRSDANAEVPTNRGRHPDGRMAETFFETTGRGGQYLMFWVVAWAEDANGNMIQELEQHGLESKPPAGCSDTSILDMPMEFYSNNVGFYDQPFYIKPAALLAAAPLRLATAAPPQPFSIVSVTASSIDKQRPYAGEQWQLEALLDAGDEDAISVYLVHSGTGPGGSLTLTGMIPFIGAGQRFADRIPFRPVFCGPHTANVTARPGQKDPVSAPITFEIPCRPQDVTGFLNEVITDASLAGVVLVNSNGQVEGRYAAIQNAVLAAEQLAAKGAVTGACQQYAQAITRIQAVANGPVALLLEDIIRNARTQLGCARK
jgi:hypothetical protein